MSEQRQDRTLPRYPAGETLPPEVPVARHRVPRSLYLLVGILTTFVVALAAGLAVLLMVRRTPPATAAETDRCGGHVALLPGAGMEWNGTLILDVSAWRLG